MTLVEFLGEALKHGVIVDGHFRQAVPVQEQEMLLDSATIKAAVAGEKWATEKVIEHYAPMIDELAVDEDMKQHLIMKLLEALPNFPMEQA